MTPTGMPKSFFLLAIFLQILKKSAPSHARSLFLKPLKMNLSKITTPKRRDILLLFQGFIFLPILREFRCCRIGKKLLVLDYYKCSPFDGIFYLHLQYGSDTMLVFPRSAANVIALPLYSVCTFQMPAISLIYDKG